jgi:hypothetical protein
MATRTCTVASAVAATQLNRLGAPSRQVHVRIEETP